MQKRDRELLRAPAARDVCPRHADRLDRIGRVRNGVPDDTHESAPMPSIASARSASFASAVSGRRVCGCDTVFVCRSTA